MAKFLAIDWDETECRYAVAVLQHEKIVVREVGIVPIAEPMEGNESEPPLTTLAKTIHDFCKEEKIGSCPLLLSLGRNHVEWVQQKLPPCKKSEIPLILKNQVLREVSGSTELDPIDYLILESSAEGHRVLALTVAWTFRRSLVRTFRSLGYPPLHIGFRAGSAAELVLRNRALLEGDPAEPYLVVNTVGNDVDLLVIAEERITALRSFRLPAEHWQQNLADEIERTLTIGLEGTTPLTVRHVILFGDGTETKLQYYLAQYGLTVQFLNPFTLPNLSVSKEKEINDPEKFAPLIGSLLLQTQKVKPVIDFLHPKEAPKPPNYARPVLLTLVLLGILCTGLYYWNQTIIRQMENQLKEVKAEHQQVTDSYQQLYPSWNVLRQTQLWEMQNIVWLDVLKELSDVLPSNTDLVVSQMTLTTGTNNPRFSGTITLAGKVRDPSVLRKLQSDLQSSGRYLVQNPAPSPNPAGGGYPWWFSTTIYRLRY